MKRIFFAVLACALSSCVFDHHNKFTVQIKDKRCPVRLYKQVYNSVSSYLAADINSVYLTDSVKFRMKIGWYDEEDESISVACKGDSLIVDKIKFAPSYYRISGKDTINIKYPPQILDTKKYDLKSLIAK